MSCIVVTGATGHIGREVVRQLAGRGHRLRAMSRHPPAIDVDGDVETVQGDLLAPETLDRAVDGADAVFLVWVAPLAAAAPAVARLAAPGRRVVLLTSPHQTPHPFFQQPNGLRAVHAGVERLIETSGSPWTFLRPGPFALNCVGWWSPQIKAGDVVRWPYAHAETAPIHEHDIAAVAVRALTEDGHDGRNYVLTGPSSVTQQEQVRIIGDAIGRPLRLEELSHEQGRAHMLTMMPAPIADMLLGAYAAAVGVPPWITTAVADVTGIPARGFERWATDHAGDFRA
jgi:uncharacterized protein YbjT (DUF2867 family)